MKLKEWIINRVIGRMSHAIVARMMDRFLTGMNPEQKKELMIQMMPQITQKMVNDMTPEDTQKVISSMVPSVMNQMLSGQGDMSSLITQMMNDLTYNKEESNPWENCPQKLLCQKYFREKP